jgi:arylsulfatase A-like enzyme
MMTGKFPYKNGFQNYELQFSDGVGVPLSNKLMPAALKELGYATAMLGKWNIGHCNEAYLPHERGFDHFVGYMCPGHGYRDFNCGMGAGYKDMLQGSALLTASGAVEHRWSVGSAYEGTYDTLLYRDKAGALVRAHARAAADASPTGADPNAAPLFLWAAQHGIHSEDDSEPEPPDDLLSAENKAYLKVLELKMNKATAENDDLFMKMRKLTASVLMSIDNSLKNLVDTLEDEGMLSNTVLFVNSDNGGDTLYAKGHPGNNFPMRSLKFSYYEGGVRVPAFVFAPGIVPEARQGSAYHGMMHHVDLMTTFFGLAGGDVAALKALDADLDGEDHWPALLGETTSPRSELVLNLPRSTTWSPGENATDEGVALRVGKYKLLTNHPKDYWFSPHPGPDYHPPTMMLASECKLGFYDHFKAAKCEYGDYLFDLDDDPTEKKNLWDEDSLHLRQVKASLLVRAQTLTAAQGHYGKILAETVNHGPSLEETLAAVNSDYVVPWKCDIVS